MSNDWASLNDVVPGMETRGDKYLVHHTDATIHIAHDKSVELCDEEGELLYSFPASWTAEMVAVALAFANNIYSKAHLRGQRDKAREISRALTYD